MPKIDIAAVPGRKGSGYPSPFDEPCAVHIRQRLGDAGSLRDFGVNLMTLPPGGRPGVRIPMHSAHPYRFQTAHRSNLKSPTVPISNRPPF